MNQNKGKHVIFLGAGASASSGYPMANRLTLLMSDRKTLIQEILRCSRDSGEEWRADWFHDSAVTRYLDSFNSATIPLRNGAFATMDELSHLSVGGEHAANIRMLKKLMRYVFALYNPHIHELAKTDYRPLIQAILGHSSRLREDISILSFNYDPYFEFSLRLAFMLRQRVNPNNPEDHARLRQAITSGFENPIDRTWLDRDGFCHLKLHGVCVFPGDPTRSRKTLPVQPGDDIPLNAHDFFDFTTLTGKLAALAHPPFSQEEPPVLLPWEIIHDSGRLLSREEFLTAVTNEWQHANLYDLFAGIWQRAKQEVMAATRFSFVGLSMGPLLQPAARYLFSGRSGTAEFIVVNPDNEHFKSHSNKPHPRSPAGRTFALLDKIVSPDFRFTESITGMNEKYSIMEQFEMVRAEYQPAITTYNTFSEFIQWELR